MKQNEKANTVIDFLKYPIQASTAFQVHCPDGFVVEAIMTPESCEYWIYHEHYGVKSLCFGLPNEKGPTPTYCYVAYRDYRESYKEEYMDETD